MLGDAGYGVMYDDNDKIIMFLMIIKSKWTITT